MVEALLEQAPWLTPTFLFLLLNIVIATIFISSAFNHRLKHPHHPPLPPPQPQLAHTPSLFSRVTSFNFSNYYPDNHHHTNSAPSFFSDEGVETTQEENVEPESESEPKPSLFTRVTSFNFPGWAAEEPEPEPEPEPEKDAREEVSSWRVVSREPSLLSRIASFSSLRKRVEEIGEVDTHREVINDSKNKKKKEEEEEEVDAKADDFINRFKQQLKMQRAESLLRYKSA